MIRAGALALALGLAPTPVASQPVDHTPPAKWRAFAVGDPLAKSKGTAVMVSAAKNLSLRNGRTYARIDIGVHCGTRLYPLIVILSSWEFLTYQPLRLRYRFDDDPIAHYDAPHTAKGENFHIRHDPFIERLKTAKKLRLEATLPDGDSGVVEFDVSGGSKAFEQVRCAK